MSGQIIRNYRWSDKPLYFQAGLWVTAIGVLLGFVFKHLNEQRAEEKRVHAFTHPKHDFADDKTREQMARSGIMSTLLDPKGYQSGVAHGGGQGPRAGSRVRERPLFDGLIATIDAKLNQSISSVSGTSDVETTVIQMLPDGALSASDGEVVKNARLLGQFQSNFETKRISIRFSELITAEGKHYAVSGVALDPGDSSIGIAANYSSGIGSRVLGEGLSGAITTAGRYGTSRILQNPTNQNGSILAELNRPFIDTGNQASAGIGDVATKDLKDTKAVLSLDAGKRFLVKLKATASSEERVP